MKIIYLADIRLPTEKAHGLQIMKTCEALARAGHEVELIVPRRRNQITQDAFEYYQCEKNFRITRIFSIDLPLGKFGYLIERFAFATAAALYVGTHASDVIYSREAFIFALMSVPGKRIVWESHTGEWDMAARATARAANRLVVHTHAAKEWYAGHGIPVEKIIVAPDGIDLSHFAHPEPQTAARDRLGLPLDSKIALYIGRVDGWKGITTFAEAAAYAPEITFACIGGEQKQVYDLRLKYKNVRWLGYRPYTELANNQSAGDVLVLPNTGTSAVSLIFTSPLKLFTYMTSRRPIVASDVPSIREVLNDDSCFFTPPDNAIELARTIREASADPVEGARRADAAFAKANDYTWDARAKYILNMV